MTLALTLTGAALVGGLPARASAEEHDESYYRAELERWAVELGKLSRHPAAAEQVEVLRGLLTEARTRLANDDADELEPLVQEIQIRGRYGAALARRAELSARAEQAQAAAAQAEAQAAKSKKAADAMQARFDQLAARGL
jgi:hypothetical protein